MAIGRPRNFDPEEALDRALRVFWERGYEGASLADLTEAMGINRPSMYATFGNKEQLFRKALDRYEQGPIAFFRDALSEPTARRVVERLFDDGIEMTTCPKNPGGCLAVHGALVTGAEGDCMRQELAQRRKAGELLLRKRLQRAKAEGDLPKDADAADLARYVVTVMRGLAVQATGGASRRELKRVAQVALAAWPA